MLPKEVVIITSHRINDTFGGVEKFVTTFSSWCYKKGIKVTVISRALSLLPVRTTRGSVSEYAGQKNKSVKTVKLPLQLYYLGLGVFSLLTFMTLLKIAKISRLSENKLLILHSQDINFSAIAAVLTGKLLQIPTVTHQHGPYLELLPTKNMKLIEQSINKIVCKLSDMIIATDRSTRNYLKSIVADGEKICVIPTAVDVSILENFKYNPGNNSLDHFKIGYVGRLSPEKNLETLLSAFKDFKSSVDSPCKLILVGDGDSRITLEALAIKLGIDKYVEFTGFQIDIKPILSTLDVFVLPSKSEGTPISLLEAMAVGKAIIASDIPPIREIVEDGKETFLFDPYSPARLKDAIFKLYHNLELRRKLGENARKKANQYDVDVVFPKIIEVYQQVSRKSLKKIVGNCKTAEIKK